MSKIGIFFGTDTGSTRLVAKNIFKQMGEELADKPKKSTAPVLPNYCSTMR